MEANKMASEKVEKLAKMLETIKKLKENRGVMAKLRAGLRENTQDRAWDFLARYCDLSDAGSYDIFRTIAGLYASHPLDCTRSSLGKVCRQLCSPEEIANLFSVEKSGPMSRRMRHLLDSDREEICERVTRIVLYAKNKNIPIDYFNLGKSLLFWGDTVRRAWAQDFWAPVEKKQKTKGKKGASS